MSGVAVIRHLLANDATLTAQVPAARIQAGVLPLNTSRPSISVTQISDLPMRIIRNTESGLMNIARVQVTVLADTYPLMKTLLALVRDACPSQRGTVNGVAVDSIATEAEGPDLYDHDTGIHEGSRDFLVRYTN